MKTKKTEYDRIFSAYYEDFIDSGYDDDEAQSMAERYTAKDLGIGRDPELFF